MDTKTMMDDRYGYGIVHASTAPEPLQFIWMLALIVLVVVGAILALRYLGNRSHGHHAGHDQTPLEVLNMRYAKGEIERAEYETIKKELSVELVPEAVKPPKPSEDK